MSSLMLADYCIQPSATLLEAAKTIEKTGQRTAILIEDYERLKVLGVLSEGDILRALIHGASVQTPVREFVRVNFTFLTEHDEVKAMELFSKHGFGLIPVVNEKLELQSVLTLVDCLRHLSAR